MIALAKKFRADPTGQLGAVVMLGFAGIAGWRWAQSGLLYFALLAIRDFAAAWFLSWRRPDANGRGQALGVGLAYCSTALPLLYTGPIGGSTPAMEFAARLFAILGFGLATLALLDLGKSFGVGPADRGLVATGIYRYIRHPMYVGYVVSESGFVILNTSNSLIFFLSILGYWMRARLEQRLLVQSAHGSN